MSDATVHRDGPSRIIFDPALISDPGASHFSPDFWGRSVVGQAPGRAMAVFIDADAGQWVLRHYHRGGLPARLSRDRYVYCGLAQTRPFREFRLLQQARADGVAVPRPVAAAVHRAGPGYRGDLLLERLPAAETLAEVLAADDMSAADWSDLARTIAQCHRKGYWHADLNARNLLRSQGRWHLIDFDRARRRQPGAWDVKNLRRLQRSLDKFQRAGTLEYRPAQWAHFLLAYRRARD